MDKSFRTILRNPSKKFWWGDKKKACDWTFLIDMRLFWKLNICLAPNSHPLINEQNPVLDPEHFRLVLETLRHGLGCFHHAKHLPYPIPKWVERELAFFQMPYGWWDEPVNGFPRSAFEPDKRLWGNDEYCACCGFDLAYIDDPLPAVNGFSHYSGNAYYIMVCSEDCHWEIEQFRRAMYNDFR